ncbi:MAG: D-aminoacyl-tRNA deacylase [Pontibacterium sp.]
MKALIQRVSQAQVAVDNEIIGSIDQGLLILLGVEKHDDEVLAEKLLSRVINYRIFSDDEGKMNLSLLDIGGDLLVVSQFTLAANTQKGRRPSFTTAAPPEQGELLYQHFVTKAKAHVGRVQTGKFGADMKVSLTNDGPVTFMLEV